MPEHPLHVVVTRHPGFDHVLPALLPEAAAAWHRTLHDRCRQHADLSFGWRAEGDQVLMGFTDGAQAVDAALGLVGSAQGDQGIAAAVGSGACWVMADQHVVGAEATLARRLVLLARVGEVLLTPSAHRSLPVPDGVGVFAAPTALSQVMSMPIHVLRDYR